MEMELGQALGSIRDPFTISPAGSSRSGCPESLATKQWIAAIEVRL
jgi:hypothetical protein